MKNTPEGVDALSIDRRRFLALAGVAAVVPGAALAAVTDSIPVARRRMLQRNGYAIDAETPLDALSTYLTPNDLFFVRHHWNPQYAGHKGWFLTIDGEVERPLRLTAQDLRRLPRTTVTCVLQCAGNGRGLYQPFVPGVQWKYGAVGNARWTGVRVRDLLEQAGLKRAGHHLHTFGSDKPPVRTPPFHRSVEIEKIMADAIVADEMNGEPLPALHGGPARLVVPGWAGEHWTKWLERLSVAAESQKGFYMETAYRYPKVIGAPGVAVPPAETRPVTELFVKSNVTEAPPRARVGSAALLRGFAFSGTPDVARVEISDDDGQSWQPADLDPQHDPWAWRLWSFRWSPKTAGRRTLFVRATDSAGAVQPREAAWNPSGYLYNGWHSASIEVDA
ncbi:MAG: sulfite oxidase [Acidobacteria bacterium]|nr:sulfite oxidase [Acidobacteriota bacterium]MCA1609578.1 sulfite oxidase [Acidobacteriota bacterium]